MRIVITGVGGHLGSSLARWILTHQPDCEIVGVDDFSCGYEGSVPRGVELHRVSLGMRPGRLERIATGARYMFHFAAYAAEGLSPFIRSFNYTNNLLATAEVVNACINTGVERIVFTSSMAVYGRGHPPFDEADPYAPIDPYGIAKASSEQDIRAAGQQHGLDWCIIRPHNLYGPGQSIWQVYRNVLGIWMARHLQGLPLLVYGDGQQQRAFSYIDDCVPCLWRAATDPAANREIINLGGANPVTIRQAAELLVDVMGGGSIEHVEQRHEVKEAWCTTARSVALLGYDEKTSLRDGLAAMWAWAQDAWALYPKRRDTHDVAPIEVERGLYSFWKPAAIPL